jgi:hypothetical protein
MDPDRPWTAQTPEALPALVERAGTFMLGTSSVGFSPDGSFLHGQSSATSEPLLYLVADRRYLAPPARPLYWVPNGHGRFVIRGADGLLVYDPRTGAAEPLAGPDVVRPFGAISRDGRWVYFFDTVVTADLWMLTLGAAP